MRRILLLLFCIYFVVAVDDWLITPPNIPVSADVFQGTGANSGITFLQLTNGLISRVFTLNPNFATIDLYNHMTNVSLLRGVKPEAQVGIKPWNKPALTFDVGGLLGQEDYAYLNTSELYTFTTNSSAFQFVSYKTSAPTARYFWQPQHHSQNAQWPPAGLRLTVTFKAPQGFGIDGVLVHVHYEMYQNIPVVAKWVTVKSNSSSVFTLETLKTEILAVTEEQVGWSSNQIDLGDMPEFFTGRIELESEWTRPFFGTTRCETDPAYTTKAQGGCNLLSSIYPMGPDQELSPTESFESFRSYVLVHNDDDRERQGLAVRRMYRTIAPQITENPIFFHLMNMTWDNITNAVDQCSEVGWEMVILSFGSDFDILNKSAANIEYYRQAVEYAHSKGIEMGGYTLMASSVDAGPEYNCIDPSTGEPEQNACLASAYSDQYIQTVLNFVDKTGFDVLETDGPYEGAQCASTEHSHHHGLDDSTWKQYEICMNFYHETRERNIYINSPDPYYLRGTNKDGMGYVEQNWSLPRWEQLLLARQNIYDGTWRKIPTQGWMFCPLTVYEGGGAEATLEPLSQHLKEYEWYLAIYFGSGVQAAWRGWRLYDTEETKALVARYVVWFNQYRTILTSDIIHVKRADGRSIDAILHVNPDRSACKEAGFAMVYNSSPYPQQTNIRLPLYYSGLTDFALVREQEGEPTQVQLARDYSITVPVKLDALSFTWFVIEPPTA